MESHYVPLRACFAACSFRLYSPNSNRVAIDTSVIIRDLDYDTDGSRLRPPGHAGFVACALRCLGSGGIRLLICAYLSTHSGYGPILVGGVIVLAFRLGRVQVCGLVFHFMTVLVSFEVTASTIRVGLVSTYIGLGTSDVLCHVLHHPPILSVAPTSWPVPWGVPFSAAPAAMCLCLSPVSSAPVMLAAALPLPLSRVLSGQGG